MKLVCFCLFLFLVSIDDGIIFPIFPSIKSILNYPGWTVSLIYGIYPGIMIIASWISGFWIYRFHWSNILIYVLIMKSILCYLFGCLVFQSNGLLTLIGSGIIRSLMAIGSAFGNTVIVTNLALKCSSNNIVDKFGKLESAFGLGSIAGPIIGAGLYNLGGFQTPLFVVAFVYGLLAFFCVCTTKNFNIKNEEITRFHNDHVGISTSLLFKNFNWLMSAGAVVYAFICVGTLAQSYLQYLQIEYGLSHSKSALCYVTGPLAYSITAAGLNQLQNLIGQIKWITMLQIGTFVSGLGFFMIGTFGLWTEKTSSNLFVSVMGNITFGVGLTLLLVAAFALHMDYARKSISQLSNVNEVAVFCQFSALFNVMQSIGLTIGPLIGEQLSIHWGFQMTFVLLSLGFMGFMIILISNNNDDDDEVANHNKDASQISQ